MAKIFCCRAYSTDLIGPFGHTVFAARMKRVEKSHAVDIAGVEINFFNNLPVGQVVKKVNFDLKS